MEKGRKEVIVMTFDFMALTLIVACLFWGICIFIKSLIYVVSEKDWYALCCSFVILCADIFLGCIILEFIHE